MDSKHDHSHHQIADSTSGLAIDPVCGMSVDPVTSTLKADHGGITYHFCGPSCRTKFIANPAKYLDPAAKAKAAADVPAGAEYTCPMHPEIRQIGPGSCPICGMALEPVMAGADTGPNHELIDMTRRFWVGLVLTLPVFVIEMGGPSHWPSPDP